MPILLNVVCEVAGISCSEPGDNPSPVCVCVRGMSRRRRKCPGVSRLGRFRLYFLLSKTCKWNVDVSSAPPTPSVCLHTEVLLFLFHSEIFTVVCEQKTGRPTCVCVCVRCFFLPCLPVSEILGVLDLFLLGFFFKL